MANPKQAKILQRFFKTGPDEYGEGDLFLGLTVPEQRRIAKEYASLCIEEIEKLLTSKIHEHRLTALIVLTNKYKKSSESQKEEIFSLYLRNTQHINNWDLVDLSAPTIVGEYLFDKDRKILYQMAKSNNLWEKRIAMLATFAFIRQNEFDDAFKLAEILLKDSHDLIHKAVGWMLREVGNRERDAEISFLDKHHHQMPRTMLRYAIEKFPEDLRQKYLARKSAVLQQKDDPKKKE